MNTFNLTGRITKDVEVRKTQSGLSCADVTIAVDRRTKSSDGSKQTDFLTVTLWRSSADFAGQYCHKGDMVGVTGSIQNNSYTDREGKIKYRISFVADNFERLERFSTSHDTQSAGYNNQQTPQAYGTPGQQSTGYNNQQTKANAPYNAQNGSQQAYKSQGTSYPDPTDFDDPFGGFSGGNI